MKPFDSLFTFSEDLENRIERRIHRLVTDKYGSKPPSEIQKQVHQEWVALLEVKAVAELAAVYALSRFLRKARYTHWAGGTTPSGFIPYLLGITHTNPLPEHLGGNRLVWQEFCSYGRLPCYVFHLPREAEKEIDRWQQSHWLQILDPNYWEDGQAFEPDHMVRGSMHFHYDAQETVVPKKPELFREDIFYYLVKHGFCEKDAFQGMCRVQKGMGLPVISEEMRTAPDHRMFDICAHKSHFPSKAEWLEQYHFVHGYFPSDGAKTPHPTL